MIKTYEGQVVHSALIDALVAQEIDRREREKVNEAPARQPHSDAVRRVAMMRHTPEEWADMTEEARVIYGGRHYAPRWASTLLIGYAMICYGIGVAWDWLMRELGM